MADYKETELSKRMHAGIMLNIAEKLFALVFAGLLGFPAMKWWLASNQSDFGIYIAILSIGSVLGIFLMVRALKCYAALGQPNDQDNSTPVSAHTTVQKDCPERLNADGPMSISIERGATKISIRVE